MDRLANKVAIVFGAGPNIGGTIAHFLAREGASVVVSDISLTAAEETVDFIRAKGFTAHPAQGNATIEADVRRVVAETVQTYGRVDIAVNMAGRVHFSHLLDMDMEDWNESVLSFPTAGLLTTRYTAQAMIDGGPRWIDHSSALHRRPFRRGGCDCLYLVEGCPAQLRTLGGNGSGAVWHPREHSHPVFNGAPAVDADARRGARSRMAAP